MGGDSCSEDCRFKSQYRILDGHFFTFICCKNCNVCLKNTKINEKEAGDGPFFLKSIAPRAHSGELHLMHVTATECCGTEN